MQPPRMFYGVDNNLQSTDAYTDLHAMLSAGMVYKISENFSFPIPECESLFVDSGGFQATSSWDLSFPYSVTRYFDWAESINADYAALPDFACEPEIHESSVEKRIELTLEHHAEALAVYEDNNYSFEAVPVLQGYYEEQYEYCIDRFKSHGITRDFMAIGTVCKRDDVNAIHDVVTTVENYLDPERIHLFGMTLNAWKDRRLHGRFWSADTSAWNWGCKTTADKKIALQEYAAKVDRIRNNIQGQQTL